MTRAPASLLEVRSLLIRHLDVDPKTARSQDLEPNEVGIVGDAEHRGGYHCGSDRVVTNDYSVVESARDRNGLTLDAAALDVGDFKVTSGGKIHTLQTFSTWCVAQCVADAPDTRDIREIIYSPDGKVVKRWDRLGRRNTGDRSHLWHTHFSFFRDAIKAGRDQRPLFRRYLVHIGLIKEDHGMDKAQEQRVMDRLAALEKLVKELPRTLIGADVVPAAREPWNNADLPTNPTWRFGYTLQTITERGRATHHEVSLLRAEMARLGGHEPLDPQVIIHGILQGIAPEVLAAHIVSVMPETLARQVVEELGSALARQPDRS